MTSTRERLVRLSLIPAFWICYLEWPGHSGFAGEIMWQILTQNPLDVKTLLHPVILFGLLGQLLLLISLGTNGKWSRWLRWGLLPMALICALVLLAGVLSGNEKMILFQVPFWLLAGILVFKK